MRRYPVFVILLGVAACAPATEWVRDNTTAVQRRSDEQACLDIANYQAFDESDKSKPIYPPFKDTQFTIDGGGDDGGGGGLTTSYSRRGARVYEISEYCMQQRGYHLIPVPTK